MEKIKALLKNKILWIVVGSVVVIVVALLLWLFVFNKEKLTHQETLTAELKTMGIDFYENFYYKQAGQTDEEKKEFLEKFKDIGIKIGLDTLIRHNKSKLENEEEYQDIFINEKSNEECDQVNTMVIVYPKEPYGNKDYTIDAILVCGYDTTETK